MNDTRTRASGWKCFDENLKCRGFQFEVGGTYEVKGELQMCAHGFHFHERGADLFNYYPNKPGIRVCEVIAHEVQSDGDKSVCRRIEVVRELSYAEVCAVFGRQDNGYGSGDGYGDGYGSGDGSGYYLKFTTTGRIAA